MVKNTESNLALYNRVYLRLIACILALLMLLTIVPMSVVDIFADDGGFILTISWQGNGDKTNYVYNSAIDESRLIRLRVNYRNVSPSQGYAPGEMVISVNGLGGAVRGGNAIPVAIAADAASSVTKYYDWSYTYSSTSDTYVFTNNMTIPAANTFDGMFEVIWDLGSRETVDHYSTDVSAKLRTAYNEQVNSNTIKYSQNRTEDVYFVRHSAKPLIGPDGLTDALPEGTTHKDYTWVDYTVTGSDTYNSLDIKDTERFDMWFLPGCIVQSPYYALTKTGQTKMFGGKQYECYSVTRNMSNSSELTLLEKIFVAYPKAQYENQFVNSYVEIKGTYNESDDELTLASSELSTNLAQFGYVDIPGVIYSTMKYSYGVFSDFVRKHCADCKAQGAVNSDHLQGGYDYTSALHIVLYYQEKDARYYDLEFTDDFIDVDLKNGQIKQLADDEYNFTNVVLAGTEYLKNMNGVSLASDKYPVEIYIRRANVAAFETTPYKTTTLKSKSQTINLPSDTVGVRILVKNVTESIESQEIIRVSYRFHTEDTNIRTDTGRVYNNMYFKIYNQDRWLNDEYDHNPSTYESNREYQRDIDTYGHTFDREFDSIHILEIPNEYRAGVDIKNTNSDKYNFYFTGDLSSKFTYQANGSVSKVSQYTILPEGTNLAENITNEAQLMESLTFAADELPDQYIREHCTAEIITDYKGSGRTYIALHYDFSDAPKMIKELKASGIPFYAVKSDDESINQVFIMRSATQVEVGSGKWYTRYKDDETMENGLWKDIDRDGNGTEPVDFEYDLVSVYKDLSAMLRAVKKVCTSTTTAFVAPLLNPLTNDFNESDIPTEYSGQTYRYSLTFSAGVGGAKNIVLCDVLEQDGQWSGTFLSVDARLAAFIIGKQPTIYYSPYEETINPEPDLTSGGWTTTQPATVKSIALDFGNAVLPEGKTISITIFMESPENADASMDYKKTKNNFISHYTPLDPTSGIVMQRTFLPSNDAPLKLVPDMGTIRVAKIDEVDGRAVAGAEFDLYRQEGATPNLATDTKIHAGYVTDSQGLIKTEKLVYGNYYFVETKAGLGYLLPENEEDRIFTVALQSDEPELVVVKKITNSRKPGQFTLKKVNDLDQKIPVIGALFNLYTAAGDLVMEGIETDGDGILTLDNMEWGDYYLSETEAPDGYDLYTEKIPFTITSNNDAGSTLTATVKDPQKPASAVLTKYEMLEDGKTVTTELVEGAVYELYRAKSLSYELVGTYITNKFGKIYVDGLAFGSYYFIETIPAEGYTKNTAKIPFVLDINYIEKSLEITTTDSRTPGSVWLQKRDEKGVIVKNAEYGLYLKATDELVTSECFADSRVTTGLFTTNSEGVIEINGLIWDEYYLKETKAPQGYQLSTEVFDVIVNRETVNKKIIIQTTDTRGNGSIKLIKVSEEDESIKLPGAEFNLYKGDGTLVAEGLKTNDEGIISVSDLDWGNYYFTETKAPAGFSLNPTKIRFSVNYLTAGKVQEITVTDPVDTINLEVTKRIATADIVFTHGNPTFTFKLHGTDSFGTSRTMYKTVVFDAQYYEAHKNDLYLEQTVIFADLMIGNYNVCEMDTQRYELDGIVDISSNGTRAADGKSVNFNLTGTNSGSATFVNKKIKQELTTHTSQITNILAKAAKLTAIVAVWNGGQITNETLNRSKLDVYAVYDDGNQVKLKNYAYTLDPTKFSNEMNGDYTVTAEYTEGGITRTDSFQVSLNVPIPFTWSMISEEPCEYDGKTYDGTVAISGYTGSSSVVVFPLEVTGKRPYDTSYTDNGKTYRVVQLGDLYVLLGTNGPPSIDGINTTGSKVENIIIPDGIEKIGMRAFYKCTNLKGDIIIPDSVTVIGKEAFSGCTGLDGDLVLSQGLEKIQEGAFNNCSNLTGDLNLSPNLNEIGKKAFYNCKKLTGSVAIPGGVKTVGESAFENCSGLSGTVTIASGVEQIGDKAFHNCSGLTGGISLPEGVKSIGTSAFEECSALDGNLTLPSTLTTISANAFKNCTKLKGNLAIPSTVTTIGESAFYYCEKLTGSVLIPGGVKDIGKFAFFYCSGLNGTLTISPGVEGIGDRTIGDRAFAFCAGLKGGINIPEGFTEIGSGAFLADTGFNGDLVLPDSLKKIKAEAFKHCYNITGTMYLPDGLEVIDYNAFMWCRALTGDINIPDTVTTLGSGAFYSCYGIKGTLTLPSNTSITSVPYQIVSKSSALKTVVIPDGITDIAQDAFAECYGLRGTLTVPQSVTTIGQSTFLGVAGLTKLRLPARFAGQTFGATCPIEYYN